MLLSDRMRAVAELVQPCKVSLISAVTMDMSRWSLSGVTSVDM